MSQAGLRTVGGSGPLPPNVPLQFTAQDLTIAVPSANNLNVFGTGGTTTTAIGDTLFIHSSATLSGEFLTDVSGPVVPTAGGIITVTGTNIYSDGSVANTLTLNMQGTKNTVFIAQGPDTPSIASNVGFNGQVFIAASGLKPAFASLTSADGSITYSIGPNALDLTVTGGTTVGKMITGQSGGALPPTAGNWNIFGATVAAGTSPLVTAGAGSTLTINAQRSQALAAADSTKIGLSNFSSAQFAVDANGFVTLSGGVTPPTLGIVPDAHTAPGTTPVVPNGSGNIVFTGSSTAAGSIPVQTNSLAANTVAIQVQKSQAIVGTDATKVGLAAFDSASFAVDANGFVTLAGGSGAAIEKVNVQTGTTPIVPSSGAITINGAVVAAGTNPVRSDGTGANTLAIEVQKSQAIAAADATKIGLSAFDSADFTVDANGFVSAAATGFIKTLTGDSGGAVSPASNNITLNGSGSTTVVGTPLTNNLTFQLTGLTNHAVLVGAGTTTITKVAATATTGQVFQNNASADPSWSTATYPSTTTINQILYSSATNVVSGLSTANNGVLITGTTGVPSILAAGTTGQVLTATTGSPPSWASPATSGTVTTVSVVSANGFAGTVANATTTPAITLTTTITGVLSGNGTAISGSAVTQYDVLVGGASNAISSVGPGSAGQVLQSGGNAANPAYSTATYPAVATTTGTILRADGTNWVKTTSTYPNTNAINTLLYASAANVMSALATTNRASLSTNSTGVPTWLALTDGQVVIGSSAGSPAAATLTAGPGITITNASNAITIGSSSSSLGYINLGITLSAGVFTVCGYNGTALSASNPAYISLPSNATPGKTVIHTVTANQTFQDHNGTSTISGNTFGTTGSIAWAQDIPFFIYAVSDSSDSGVSFMISRMPGVTIAPTAGKIGKTGSAVASTQGSFFALSSPTVASYASQSCLCIGAIRMQKNSSDDWTISSLSNGTGFGGTAYIGADGIGQFHQSSQFTMPFSQNGAATNTYFLANGGTAPVFSTNSYLYYVKQDRTCSIYENALNCTTAGTGAVNTRMSMPYVSENSTQLQGIGIGVFSTNGYNAIGTLTSGQSYLQFQVQNTTPVNPLTNASFNLAASTTMIMSGSYVIEYI